MAQSDEEHSCTMNAHPNVFLLLSKYKSYKQLNKYLASFGLTKGERKSVVRQLKDKGYSHSKN